MNPYILKKPMLGLQAGAIFTPKNLGPDPDEGRADYVYEHGRYQIPEHDVRDTDYFDEWKLPTHYWRISASWGSELEVQEITVRDAYGTEHQRHRNSGNFFQTKGAAQAALAEIDRIFQVRREMLGVDP